MREFDDLPRCCEDAATAACDSCPGFDPACEAYREAVAETNRVEQRFRKDYAAEIAASRDVRL